MFCFPLGFFLIILRVLSTFMQSGMRQNRYSVFEKARRDYVGADFRDKTDDGGMGDTQKKADTAPKKTKKRNRFSDRTTKVLGIVGASVGTLGLFAFLEQVQYWGLGLLEFSDIAVPTGLIATGAAFGIAAISRHRKLKMQKKLAAVIGKRGCVSLDEISEALGIGKSAVLRHLQGAIDAGAFGEYAYIDMSRGCFLKNSSFAPKSPEKEKTVKEKAKEKTESGSGIDEYDRIINEIIRLNVEIEDEVVSEKIDRIEEYTRSIFDTVKDDPEKLDDIRTFMTYYLPTTLKLLGSYSEIERIGVAGDNMKLAKENIEQTLDMLTEAFKKQLDMLYRSDSIDISSDIDVLEQMMRKDGLTDDIADFGATAAKK